MKTPAQTTIEVHTSINATTEKDVYDTHTPVGSAAYMEALGWAFTHAPTQEAYRRSTGEDVAPAITRYRAWLEENIIGPTELPDRL